MHTIKTYYQLIFGFQIYRIGMRNIKTKSIKKVITQKQIDIGLPIKWLGGFFMTIKRALPNMFHYLDNPKTPKLPNAIESFFGHVKGY